MTKKRIAHLKEWARNITESNFSADEASVILDLIAHIEALDEEIADQRKLIRARGEIPLL